MGRYLNLLELIYKTTRNILDTVKRDDDVAGHLHAGNRKRMVDELISLEKKSLENNEKIEDGTHLLKKINDLDRDIIKEINRHKERISAQIAENFKMKSYMKRYNISGRSFLTKKRDCDEMDRKGF